MQRRRGIKASAVFICGPYVVGPGWIPGCGESDESIFGEVLGSGDKNLVWGVIGCEGLCSDARFILW